MFFIFLCVLEGINLAKRINKIGMLSSDTAQIFFEDVRVPAKNIVGEEGLGFTYQMLQVRFHPKGSFGKAEIHWEYFIIS